MGDCVGVQLLVTEIYLGLTTKSQLSLAIPPWVGGMSTGDGLLAIIREETASSERGMSCHATVVRLCLVFLNFIVLHVRVE